MLWRIRRERLLRRVRTAEFSTMSQHLLWVNFAGGTAVLKAWRNMEEMSSVKQGVQEAIRKQVSAG